MEAALKKKKREKRKKSHLAFVQKFCHYGGVRGGVWETTSYPPIEFRLFVLVMDAPGFVSVKLYKNHRALIGNCICIFKFRFLSLPEIEFPVKADSHSRPDWLAALR